MSENRETPAVGAPVEEAEASRTEVLEAVERAKAGPTDHEIVAPGASSDAAKVVEVVEVDESVTEGSTLDAAAQQRREASSQVDTQLDLEIPTPRIAETEVMPSAAADPAPAADTPARDGEIRISADHPMAALYTQTPAPPEIRGNRGPGVLITLLATVAFAVVYAGVLALWAAPHYPPSTFLGEGLLPQIMSIGFAAAVVGFFVAMTLVVLIVGRAGWWAYVLGGFLVAVAVWAIAALGAAAHDGLVLGNRVNWDLLALGETYGFTVTAIVAALVAREVTVWFGAWVGARGRKVKARNIEALAEYEEAMAEVQAKSA